MRIGAVLSPVADVDAIITAAREADRSGLDAIGLWDHYHSPRAEWGYVAGWGMLGALAAVTERVRIVPMVLNNLHYPIGVLAKESSVLSRASAGRFELGIGAGDWPESFPPWGERFPPIPERLGRLRDALTALRELWRGEPVTMHGDWLRLAGATSTPAPGVAPRVVVGVGRSRRALGELAPLADEINVYVDDEILEAASGVAGPDGRPVAVSAFLAWEWDKWPTDPEAELKRLSRRGIDRAFVSLGATAPQMIERIRVLSHLSGSLPS